MATVKMVASTMIHDDGLKETGYIFHHERESGEIDHDVSYIDELGEAAGRLCYLAWDRKNPNTQTNETYLNHIHEVGHESVEEHGSVTFYIDASRSVLTELERHRFLSFSVVSQRYVDMAEHGAVHIPPAIHETKNIELYNVWVDAMNHARQAYIALSEGLADEGLPRKQAREAARSVLPNALGSPMFVTGNLRAWKNVIRLRNDESADREIQEVAKLVLEELRKVAPNTVSDIN